MTTDAHVHAAAADFVPRVVEFGGEACVLRRLEPVDAAHVQEFFYTHTRETIQMRYGHAVARMTEQRSLELVSVNQSRDVALAILGLADGREVIHAIGRYYLDPDEHSAEAAFVVRESKRRLGMASLLLRAMRDLARHRGLNFVWGRVHRDNLPMLALFRRFGGTAVPTNDESNSDVVMRVPLRPSRKAARKPRAPVPHAPRAKAS